MAINLNFHFSKKDEVAGEVPIAFVVRAHDAEIDESAIKEFVAKQVYGLTCMDTCEHMYTYIHIHIYIHSHDTYMYRYM